MAEVMRVLMRITLVPDLMIFSDFFNFVLDDRCSYNIGPFLISKHLYDTLSYSIYFSELSSLFQLPQQFYFIYNLGYQHSSKIGINT